ncbi:RNA 2',3'-cyclic phosphodiesterase [Thalassococcus sp. CAU 1522]|uniref:RNA 2',3'-cyclic phosphodiesterase n=1 Tax=Thalassococcus arenae TaxID=2851652 RepID=A0ABS6N5K7_9RHOB|nr:RNA 2',3'-cyclic phosphodiesterase [Thalassococcus arenae]MBV2359299.1 RNA 2',3'-cyclic phosphodiesterase [Thalassococcus arenae]
MRAFVALPLPDALIDPVQAIQARLPAGRAVPQDNLHLTLAFLDDQPEDALAEIDFGLSALRAAPVPLRLAGLTSFGGDHGQALALIADPDPALIALHDAVRRAVMAAGVTLPRRRFRPHVTIARLRRGDTARPDMQAALATQAGVALPPALADRLALVGSTLAPGGARHEILATYPLG